MYRPPLTIPCPQCHLQLLSAQNGCGRHHPALNDPILKVAQFLTYFLLPFKQSWDVEQPLTLLHAASCQGRQPSKAFFVQFSCTKNISPFDFSKPQNPAPAQVEYEIRVQLLEIYNEQLRDLLDDGRGSKRLDIRNTERSGLNVPEAIQVVVHFYVGFFPLLI